MDIRAFVAAYKSEDDERIRFAWNGEHGDAFEDPNAALRGEVLDYVLQQSGDAPLGLLRCLFEAETRCAKETWGVDERIHVLGEALLQKGGADVALEFMRGKMLSFDTHCGLGRARVELALARTLCERCQQVLDSPADESERLFAEQGVEFFGWLVELGEE